MPSSPAADSIDSQIAEYVRFAASLRPCHQNSRSPDLWWNNVVANHQHLANDLQRLQKQKNQLEAAKYANILNATEDEFSFADLFEFFKRVEPLVRAHKAENCILHVRATSEEVQLDQIRQLNLLGGLCTRLFLLTHSLSLHIFELDLKVNQIHFSSLLSMVQVHSSNLQSMLELLKQVCFKADPESMIKGIAEYEQLQHDLAACPQLFGAMRIDDNSVDELE